MRLFIPLLAIALMAPEALSQTCGNPEVINVEMVETSTGPYMAGDTFEVTLNMSSTPGSVETMETSTMVIDFNDAALDYADSPTNGTDFEWLLFQGFGNTSQGGIRNYTSTVTITSESRITPFVNLDFTSDTFGEEIPDTPTAALILRWTVVDPEAGISVTPRSEQFFQGPRPPLGGGIPTPCLSPGTFTGVEYGQTTVAGDRGWRLLSPPAPGFSLVDALGFNYVEGYPGIRANRAPNPTIGYDGTDYMVPSDPAAPLDFGLGMYWFLYDQDFTRGVSTSFALPMQIHHSGQSQMDLIAGGLLPDQIQLPLHADGNGWNLMGNPTGTPIDATQIQPIGGSFATPIVQVWQDSPGTDGAGTYVLSSDIGGIILPWQGFFLENSTATGMAIPADARILGGPAPPVKAGLPLAEQRRTPEASLGLRLRGISDTDGATFEDRAARLVLSPRAKTGRDALDATKLTPFGQRYVALAFVGADGETLRAQEARPLAEGGVLADLALDAAGVDGAFTLEWDLSAFPDDVSVQLLDRGTGEAIDLRADETYAFRAGATRPARRTELARPRSLTASALAPEAARFVLAVGRDLPDAPLASAKTRGLPETLELAEAAPNPFRAETTLRYALPEAGAVRMTVYDLLGRSVAEVVDEEQEAGYHSATFASRGLAAGVYVVRLDVGGEMRTRRVTVVR